MSLSFLKTAVAISFIGGLQVFATSNAIAQNTDSVPFVEENWVFIGGTEVVDLDGQQALQLGVKQDGAPFGFGTAQLKRAPFTNGIIEYDILFGQTRTFAGISFRAQDAGNFENFYMRAHQSGNPDANQYMPNYNGIQSWQLYYGEQYSAPTNYSFDEWMSVKLVISGKLADIYIGDMSEPEFSVELKRDEQTGGIGLWAFDIGGPVWFANFKITPMDSVEIVGTPVMEQPASEGTVMSWQVSSAFDGATLAGNDMLPKDMISGLSFQALDADVTGITNLAKLQGVAPGQDTVFAKVIINSQSDQTKQFQFGFSDAAKVYLNGQPLFKGSDGESSRDYRFLGTVGYFDTVFLPLKSGKNELVIAVSESVALTNGWAIQGRFDDMSGIGF